jgi:molybdopterin synthase sulfur carrier subunit
MAMPIKIRYFASLREKLGRSEDMQTYKGPVTIRELWQQVVPEMLLPDSILAAVNMEYADLDEIVQDDDEVAFFPPVTGG